jgi:integration host factor subunit alpha
MELGWELEALPVETLELVLEREARMSITKKDIAKNIKTKALTDNRTSNKLIDSFIEIVKAKSLSNDIKIAHFGTFTNKVTPQRIGRNPKTGDEHIISERVKLNFVVSNKIKEQLN